MKIRVCPLGYTIVEVMIFLAVSGGLFASAALLMSGQQQKTQFTQSLREIESQILDVMNDVSTGYYANTNNFSCSTPGPGRPAIIASGGPANSQGANEGCIFIGRAIQFTDGEEFRVFNVAGRRLKAGTNKEAADLSESWPTAIVQSSSSPSAPPASESLDFKNLNFGLKVERMQFKQGAVVQDIGAFGFYSSLGQYDSTGANLVSGSQTVNLVPLVNTDRGMSPEQTAERINSLSSYSFINPNDGVEICFKSGGTDLYGLLTIGGGTGRQLSTKLEIKGSC